MESGMNILGALLKKNPTTKHKGKPKEFTSIAGGVQKRLESNLKYRKSRRLTQFDVGRDLSGGSSPARVTQKTLTDAQVKAENRRLQLEKWKQEKDTQKKIVAAEKKKPFKVGVYHAPLKYEPVPPLKVLPSTSGRVTRSQILQNKIKPAPEPKLPLLAPKNARFHPPKLKNVPVLTSADFRPKNVPIKVTFDPLPQKQPMLTRAQKAKLAKEDNKIDMIVKNKKPAPTIANKQPVKAKVIPGRKSPKKARIVKPILTSTSSSETILSSESSVKITLRKTPNPRKTRAPKPIFTSKSSSDTNLSSESSINMPTYKMLEKKLSTPKAAIPKSESSSEEKLRSPKNPVDLYPVTPEEIAEQAKNISPRVTLSRGKDNARKETMSKIKEGLLDDDMCETESVQQFRRQLASEIKRMTEMADHWDKVYEQNTLPEFVQELVLTAVGQARLLMSRKLQQFSGLVDRCEAPEPGAALVTPADLQGFWDMVFMQIENVDVRFKKLEELRARNWAEEPTKQKKRLPAKKNTTAAISTKPAAAAPSRLKEMIAAARRAQKQKSITPKKEETKTFEGGFFSVQSPVRNTPATPAFTPGAALTPNNTQTLLKTVLSSEANKASATKSSASYAMLRASLLSKNVQIDGVSPLELTPKPVNLEATPARSILKSAAKVASTKKSAKKSIRIVVFDEDCKELLVENTDDNQHQNIDSGLSSLENEQTTENKTPKRRQRLKRQDAVNSSPVSTRNQRKASKEQTDSAEHNKRSTRKLQTIDTNIEHGEPSPKKSSRNKKSIIDLTDFDTPKYATRKSTRLSKIQDENEGTPKRSARKRGKKSTREQLLT